MTQDEARARVAKGAARLDDLRPGWARHIDVGTLTLHDPCGCIVGQLAGSAWTFTKTWSELFPSFGEFDGAACGVFIFADDNAPLKEAYQPLQDAWIEAIADRLLPTVDEGTTADAVATPMDVRTARPIA